MSEPDPTAPSASFTHALHLWPCAIHLASWLWRQRDNIGAKLKPGVVLELGAGGTALPSVVVAKICGAGRKVIISEQRDRPDVYKLLAENLSANELTADNSNVSICELDWTDNKMSELQNVLCDEKVCMLLASDCMYDDSVFDIFLASVATILRRFGAVDARCVLSFQERDANWTLSTLLVQHGLRIRPIVSDYHVECAEVRLPSVRTELSRRMVHLAVLELVESTRAECDWLEV